MIPWCLVAQASMEYNQDNRSTLVQYVMEFPGMQAEDIYRKTRNWVVETYKNPDVVIKGEIQNEMIKGVGAGSNINVGSVVPDFASFTYQFRIDIKDEKARYTMDNMRLRGEAHDFSAEQLVYKANGDEKTGKSASRIRSDIEMQANALISNLQSYIDSKPQSQLDDW